MAWINRALSMTRKASRSEGTTSRRLSSRSPSPQDRHTRAVGAGALGVGAAQWPQNQAHSMAWLPPSTSLSAGLDPFNAIMPYPKSYPLHPGQGRKLYQIVHVVEGPSGRSAGPARTGSTGTERGGFEPPNEVNPRYAISSRAR